MRKGLLSLFLTIFAVSFITATVNAEELTSTMVKDLDLQIESVDSDMGSFTLLKSIDFTKGKSKLDYAICYFKKTSTDEKVCNIDEDKFGRGETFTFEGLKASYSFESTGLYYDSIENKTRGFADYDFVGVLRVLDENGVGEIITYSLNDSKITKIEKVGTTSEDTKEADKTTIEDKVVTIEGQDSISSEALAQIKADGNKVTHQFLTADKSKVAYAWIFDGSKMDSTDFNIVYDLTVGESTNKEKIESLVSNKNNSLVLNFSYHGELPKGTSVKVYVGDKYANGEKVTLYYYNDSTNKLETIQKDIVVVDGYVTFGLEHCSDYVLEKQVVENNPNTLDNIQSSIIIAGISAIALIITIMYSKRKLFN